MAGVHVGATSRDGTQNLFKTYPKLTQIRCSRVQRPGRCSGLNGLGLVRCGRLAVVTGLGSARCGVLAGATGLGLVGCRRLTDFWLVHPWVWCTHAFLYS